MQGDGKDDEHVNGKVDERGKGVKQGSEPKNKQDNNQGV